MTEREREALAVEIELCAYGCYGFTADETRAAMEAYRHAARIVRTQKVTP